MRRGRQECTVGRFDPWVLGRVADLTGGRSVEANLALIENNTSVAGEIAVALASVDQPHLV